MFDPDQHVDRSVIVTGAASGIGRGIALAFAEAGANLVIADVRREPRQGTHYVTDVTEPTDTVAREEHDVAVEYVETDVSDPAAVERMIEAAVEAFGGIDVLVNNAGIYIPGTSQELSLEDWERVRSVNLDGAFYTARAAVPHLRRSGGCLLNVASVHAFQGGGGPPYASAKAGLVNLTRDLAVELGPDGVTVNAICPGFVETAIQDYLSDADIQAAREQTLVPRFGTPADVGSLAVFLSSEEASFIHGEAIAIDGGWSAHRG